MTKSRVGKCSNVAAAFLATVALAGSAASTRAQTMEQQQSGAMMNMRAKNAQMLLQTLSEEKTEINTLTAQQARFRRLGGGENNRIAAVWGRWIAEHKAASPMLVQLIRANGGDPMRARILKAPVLGSKARMMMATHKDHEAAVATSKARARMTNNGAVRNAMARRVALAGKHLREMARYHDAMRMRM